MLENSDCDAARENARPAPCQHFVPEGRQHGIVNPIATAVGMSCRFDVVDPYAHPLVAAGRGRRRGLAAALLDDLHADAGADAVGSGLDHRLRRLEVAHAARRP